MQYCLQRKLSKETARLKCVDEVFWNKRKAGVIAQSFSQKQDDEQQKLARFVTQ